MKIIINADDFGYSTETNTAIHSLVKAGRVSSASILANAPAFDDAIDRIRDILPLQPHETAAAPAVCSFGVHLNLTEFPALTDQPIFYDRGVVNQDGRFTKQVRQARPSLQLLSAIENEWGAQIEKVLAQDISITHLDSHHHIHTIPWLFPALKRLQKKYQINKVRISANWYDTKEYSPSAITWIGKCAWNRALRIVFATSTTDGLASLNWFIRGVSDGKRREHEVVEIMCHPGRSWADDETRLLWTDWMQQLPQEVRLISYHQL